MLEPPPWMLPMSFDEPLKTNAFVRGVAHQAAGWSAGAGALNIERVDRPLGIHVAGDADRR